MKENQNSKAPKKTVVIGAGIAGLALAVRRKIAGDEVEVYEAAPAPGGKLYQFEKGGYRFDGGPSLFTQPQYVEELFQLAKVPIEKYFQYSKMDESCRYFWEDGTQFQAAADRAALEKSALETFNLKPGKLSAYLDHAAWKYEKVGRIFLDRSLHRWRSWWRKDVLKAVPYLFHYGLFKSLNRFNKKFFTDPRLVQLFNRYATYNGSDPYRTSGMMSMIPHFEFNEGTFLPRGGMYNIARSLFQLGKDLGVSYFFDSKVDEILHNEKQATGIRIHEKTVLADRVVSNVDIHATYHKLLPQLPLPRQVRREERSSSAFIFYWGMKTPYPSLGLHNIFFTRNYKAEFQAIKNGTIHPDPTIYVNITSKIESEDAPAQKENWFVMVNTPHDQGQDWKALAPQIRQTTIEKLSRLLGRPIAPDIEVEQHWDPTQIEADTSSVGGALYGSASNDMMAAFNRHPNFHPKVKNLYFCGGSVHPGGGIPLCLLSARITDQEIDRY